VVTVISGWLAVANKETGTCTSSPRHMSSLESPKFWPHIWLSRSVAGSVVPPKDTVVLGRNPSPKMVSGNGAPPLPVSPTSTPDELRWSMKGMGLVLFRLTLAVLLARLGSASVAATVTVLVMFPVAVASTGMLIVAMVPGAIVPRLHVTVLPLTLQLPSDVVIGD